MALAQRLLSYFYMNQEAAREYPSLSRSLLTMARASVALLSDQLITMVRRDYSRGRKVGLNNVLKP